MIQPVFPQQGRFGIQRREQGVLHYRDISGVEHAFETILLIQRLRQVQDVPVRVPGGSHDELGALTRRGKDRSVLVLYQLRLALGSLVPNQRHGPQNGLLALIRGQRLQPLLGGEFDIHAEPVRQEAQLLHQLRRCAGDSFGVDISVEPVFLPQQPETFDHLFGCVVRAAKHTRGEEQPLNIIAPVKFNGQFRQLPGRKGGSPCVVRAAIDTVFAVIHAAIGHQNLQQGDTSPVGGKAVAATRYRGGGVADHTRTGAPANAAGGAGCIIFSRIGQDGQLIQQFHGQCPQAVRRRGWG